MANKKTINKADPKTAVSTTETNTSVKETPVAAAVKEEPKATAPAAKAEAKPEAAPAPKTEAKTPKKPGRKPGRKPGAKSAAAAKPAGTAKRTAAKKTDKPAKTAVTKKAAKAEVQTADAPKRKGGRKPKPMTIEDLCAKLSKKIDKTKAAAVGGTIATDVEVWGWDDGSNKHLFIEVADGKVRVEPYNYEHSNFNSYISFADAKAFIDGKLTLTEALALGKLNAIGVVGDALKLASIF